MRRGIGATGRVGFTTGACGAAAAKGCAVMLATGRIVDRVDLLLPTGDRVWFSLHGQRLDPGSAACFVIKDAGGDLDVTDGAEIHAAIRLYPGRGVLIRGGEGVGRVTKPGLAVPVGEWAINPVPRRMIEEGIREGGGELADRYRVDVTISVPDGLQRAERTINARLGIVGGLSILGTTGLVIPISAQAWIDTIAASLDVARAAGTDRVVLSAGRSSELAVTPLLSDTIPEEGFILMGDHVGEALRLCREKGVRSVTIAAQFAKMVKIASGHPQTHVGSSRLDLDRVAGWFDGDPGTSHLSAVARRAATARHLLEESGYDRRLTAEVCRRAAEFTNRLSGGIVTRILLVGYGGELLHQEPAGVEPQ
ncbi:MAG: cobalt-precorrin-5B (C(1))-methyltransferase [Desulfuromonadia bacterium]